MVPSFVVNSLPKAGTNLLVKALHLFPGIRKTEELHISYATIKLFYRPTDALTETVCIDAGVDYPVGVQGVRRALASVGRGSFASMHAPYSDELARMMADMHMKSVLIFRDPRDAVVSHAKYVSSLPNHRLFKQYENLSPHARLMRSIEGVAADGPRDSMLYDINIRCRRLLDWMRQPFVYTTYYEKLVGPLGGGSEGEQLHELGNIAKHLGIRFVERDIQSVAARLFGGTRTFDKGQIGKWPEHFSPEHKATFKRVAGPLLIELGYEKDLNW
jgi:hypothetical protein